MSRVMEVQKYSRIRYKRLCQLLRDSGRTIMTEDDYTIGQSDKDRIKEKIRRLVLEIDPTKMAHKHEPLVKKEIESEIIDRLHEDIKQHSQIIRSEIMSFIRDSIDEVLGYGVITRYLKDPDVSEVMVNGQGEGKIFYEKRGIILEAIEKFQTSDQIMHVIDSIVGPMGRKVDESTPYVDTRLPNGSRVNIVIPPISLTGPIITIRKFRQMLTIEEMVELYKTLAWEDVAILRACVAAKLNIVVSGGTGSGKTTTLNILSSFIDSKERIITCEDAAEIEIRHPHWIRLETRPANSEGKGAVTMRDMVKNTLRMRPDRIVIGEVRDGTAFDMLQAMNTGHDGSLTTGHANSAKDIVSRLENMVLMADMGLPVDAIRNQIISAIHLIVHQERRCGERKIVEISYVDGIDEHGNVKVTPIKIYDPLKKELVPTGNIPPFINKLKEVNGNLPKWLGGDVNG